MVAANAIPPVPVINSILNADSLFRVHVSLAEELIAISMI